MDYEIDCYVVHWFKHTAKERAFDTEQEAVDFATKLIDNYDCEHVVIQKVLNVLGWY